MKTTVLHQLKSAGYTQDGMGYLIQFKSGQIALIDGGMLEDAPIILELLKKISDQKIPTVDYWFITHPHMDHDFALIGMGENYSEKIRVKRVLYDFPDDDFYKHTEPVIVNELKRMEAAIDRFDGVERIKIKSGDRFYFGEDFIDVLYTASDLPPFENAPIAQCVNDISAVLRLQSEGQKLLFLGDVVDAGNRILIDRYGKDLKSDVVQMAHHGGKGSTEEFYSYVDPEILLWPISEPLFWPLYNVIEVNKKLMAMNVKDIVLAGHGLRSMPLPIKPSVAPFLPQAGFPPMEVRAAIKKASFEPSLDDLFCEVWDEAEPLDAFCSYEGKRNKTQAEYKLLWTDDALWFRAQVKAPTLISDPDCHASTNSNNIRLHLCERLMDDIKMNWARLFGDEFLRDLRIYPEEKNLPFAKAFNSNPSRCTSFGKTTDDTMIYLAKINFAKPHKKGDIIGFHAELNMISEYKGYYTLRAMLSSAVHGQMYRYCPAGLPRWELD